MNKKVLSALLFSALFAGTGTFTSCIDNDEPEGIENLRNAKAQLIAAKAEVEKANASYVLAETERVKAVAAVEQANAAYRQAEAKKMEAQAEAEQARTEEAKAYAEMMIAKYQNQMAVEAENLKSSLANAQKWAAQAEFAYQTALKQIEVAKALGIETLDNATLEALEQAVKDAYEAIYVDTYMTVDKNDYTLVEAIREAEETLYNAMLNKAAGLDDDGNVDASLWIPSLELTVAEKEVAVIAAEEHVAKLETFLDKDVETTDWRAEIEALNDSVEALKLAVSEKEVEKTKALNSEEYLAADQKLNGVKDENGNVVKNGTVQTLAAKKAEYDMYAVGGSKAIKLTLSKIEVKPVAELEGVIDDAVDAYEADNGVTISAWNDGVFGLAKTNYYQPTYGTKLTAANGYVPALYLAQINYFAAALAKAELDENAIVGAQNKKAAAEKEVAEMDSLYNEVAYVQWEIAKKAVNEKVATPIAAADVKKVTDAIAAYNAGATAFNNAVAAYNNAYKAIYDGAKTKYVEDKYYETYWNVIETYAYSNLGEYPYNVNNHHAKVDAVKAYQVDKGWKTICEELEAMFVVDPAIKDNKDTEENEATVAAERAAEILAEAKKEAKKEADILKAINSDWEEPSTDAAENAILADEDETLADALETIETKAEALNDAGNKGLIASLSKAYTEYATLAKTYYAQVPTEAAAKISLPGVPKDKNGNVEWYTKPEKADANGHVLLTSKVAAMSEENAAKKIEMELSKDDTVLMAALNAASQAAFGMNERYIEPTEEEVRDAAAGAWYNWLVAQDELESLENYLASADKLEEVVADLAAAKKALETETAANEAKFADLDAAVVAANTANEAAKKELNAIKVTLVGELNVEVAKLQAEQSAVKNVVAELRKAVTLHLHIDLDNNANTNLLYADAEAFEKALESALLSAKEAVATAEQELAKAKVELQKAEDGKYDEVAEAQYKLEQLNAELTKRQAEYDEALADLEKAMEIWAAAE